MYSWTFFSTSLRPSRGPSIWQRSQGRRRSGARLDPRVRYGRLSDIRRGRAGMSAEGQQVTSRWHWGIPRSRVPFDISASLRALRPPCRCTSPFSPMHRPVPRQRRSRCTLCPDGKESSGRPEMPTPFRSGATMQRSGRYRSMKLLNNFGTAMAAACVSATWFAVVR